MRRLTEDLLDAASVYYEQQQFQNPDRHGARLAIRAFVDFLERTGYPAPLLMPLLNIEGAFEDLENGKTDHLFRSANTSQGRPPDGWQTRRLRLIAAAITHMLMQGGMAEKDATSQMANHLSKLGHGIKGGPIKASQVRTWLSEIREGRTGVDQQKRFNRMVAELSAQNPQLNEADLFALLQELVSIMVRPGKI